MLEFKQVGGSGPPPDIEVVTDDAGAEMASINDVFEEAGYEAGEFVGIKNYDEAQRGEDNLFRFVIPGEEAGEVGDVWNDLADFLDECNEKAIAAAEAAEEED